MNREAEKGRRPAHGIFPPNYVTLQQLKENKEKELKTQKEEEEKKKKQQEQERGKIKEPSVRSRSDLPPNYVTLQQLKERKEQNLQIEEDGKNNKEEKENKKLQEQSLRRRRDVGSVNRDPSDSGWKESTREDFEKTNLQQAAKNGCRGATANGVAKDGRRPSGRLHGDRKTFTGWGLGNPAHRQKNGEAPSDVHQEDATVEPCVEKVWHGKGNIGVAATKSSSDSEIPRAKGNGHTDLRTSATSATGRISRLGSKGELVNTKAVELVEEGTSVTAKAVTVAPEETQGDENKNEGGKERKKRFKKKAKKKPQSRAQASEDSANTATVEEEAAAVVPVTENVPAAKDTAGDDEMRRASEKQKEKKWEGSVQYLEKDLVRKVVLANSTNERQSRSWGRHSEKRASLMWVRKG